MSGKIRVRWRVIKRNTAPEHRETKKFRAFGQRFDCVGHALATLINAIGQLSCDWSEIHIRLTREGGDGREAERS